MRLHDAAEAEYSSDEESSSEIATPVKGKQTAKLPSNENAIRAQEAKLAEDGRLEDERNGVQKLGKKLVMYR